MKRLSISFAGVFVSCWLPFCDNTETGNPSFRGGVLFTTTPDSREALPVGHVKLTLDKTSLSLGEMTLVDCSDNEPFSITGLGTVNVLGNET